MHYEVVIYHCVFLAMIITLKMIILSTLLLQLTQKQLLKQKTRCLKPLEVMERRPNFCTGNL
jgi:hypothetical protein